MEAAGAAVGPASDGWRGRRVHRWEEAAGIMEATVSMGDHAMTNLTTKPDSLQRAAEMAVDLFDNWFDPIETEVRAQRTTNAIERLHEELDQDADHAAVGRYRRDVVLGAARLQFCGNPLTSIPETSFLRRKVASTRR